MKIFREIVKGLLEAEEITLDMSVGLILPRSLFASAVSMLKKGRFLTKAELLLLGKEFLSVLDELNVSISQKNRDYFLGKKIKIEKKGDWKTETVWKGAYGHEKSQPRDTY